MLSGWSADSEGDLDLLELEDIFIDYGKSFIWKASNSIAGTQYSFKIISPNSLFYNSLLY